MKRAISLLIAIALTLFFVFSVNAEGFNDLKVTLAADSYSVKAGDQFKVTLGFDNASEYPYGLAAFCAILRFDKSKLSVKKIDVAAPRANVMNNIADSEMRTLYTFTSTSKKPGFNTNGAFYTVTFEALESTVGMTEIGVTFDTVVVTDYDSKQLNYKIGFNTPSVVIDIKNDKVSSESVSYVESTPSEAPQSSSSFSTSPSSVASEPAVSSNKPSVSSTVSKAPSSAGSTTSTEFEDVTSTEQDISTDVFDDNGKVTSTSESKGQPSSNKGSSDKDDSKGLPVALIVTVCVLAVVIGGGVLVLVFKKKK